MRQEGLAGAGDLGSPRNLTRPTTGLVQVILTGFPSMVAGPTYAAQRELLVTGAVEWTLSAPGTELPTRT